MEHLAAVLKIIVIDIVLSGDNAVVIALAAHKLPVYQRKRAIMWGGGIAIVLRILFTLLMSFLLMVPGLTLLGGLVLVWIACKLLVGEEEDEITPDNADAGALAAIRMIFIADFMMSLDNMLAVAGASHGNYSMLLMGLLISIAIIMTCSSLVARLMNRYKWIVYVGAGILALTAADMMIEDREVAGYFVRTHHVQFSHHWDKWLAEEITVRKFDAANLPDSLREIVSYQNGKLQIRGPLAEPQYQQLLERIPEEISPAKPEPGEAGWFSRTQSLFADSKRDRIALTHYYENHARIVPVPKWVPAALQSQVGVWLQHKWPAENWKNVQGRDYSFVAWIFKAVVIAFCMSAPCWWPGHKQKAKPADAAASSVS